MNQPESTSRQVDVSIVLPVHNENGHIVRELDRIRTGMDASPYSYEIIAVDDGSSDGSKERLRSIEGIVLIDLPVNRGCGNARKLGSRAASGKYIVWTDVDMTYPNDQIPLLIEGLEQGYDQVVGDRRTEQGTHAWLRRPTKWFIRSLASYLMQTKIPDLNSGFRAFRGDVGKGYLHLLPTGFSCVSTITLAFLSNGHSILYLPIDYAPRQGESKFHWRVDTYQYTLQVIRMVMTFNPLRVFFPVGGFLVLLALGKIIFDIFHKNFYISSNAVVLTVVSIQVIATGLMADLMARVWKQNQDR